MLLPVLFFVLPFFVKAQYLTAISSRYDDSFIEWRFYAENEAAEEEEGELKIRWQIREDDWSEWDYRIGEVFGTIKMKWKDNPEEWELRGNNLIVSARTLWPRDFREWRISDGTTSVTLKSKWTNQADEWLLRDTDSGNFSMYTNYERDPRDWVIVDELNDEVSFEMKLMMMFIVVFNSTPRQ